MTANRDRMVQSKVIIPTKPAERLDVLRAASESG